MTWYELCIVVRMQHEWTRISKSFQVLYCCPPPLVDVALYSYYHVDRRRAIVGVVGVVEWWSQ
jgi:hypothetical protein